jgi:hypothetical protein
LKPKGGVLGMVFCWSCDRKKISPGNDDLEEVKFVYVVGNMSHPPTIMGSQMYLAS